MMYTTRFLETLIGFINDITKKAEKFVLRAFSKNKKIGSARRRQTVFRRKSPNSTRVVSCNFRLKRDSSDLFEKKLKPKSPFIKSKILFYNFNEFCDWETLWVITKWRRILYQDFRFMSLATRTFDIHPRKFYSHFAFDAFACKRKRF